jgi:hypothetical protein
MILNGRGMTGASSRPKMTAHMLRTLFDGGGCVGIKFFSTSLNFQQSSSSHHY